MVRISDARMSGTAYGTVVLHTAPEAAAGGPLALVKNGDLIELDVGKRKLVLHVSEPELALRRGQLKPGTPHSDRVTNSSAPGVLRLGDGCRPRTQSER